MDSDDNQSSEMLAELLVYALYFSNLGLCIFCIVLAYLFFSMIPTKLTTLSKEMNHTIGLIFVVLALIQILIVVRGVMKSINENSIWEELFTTIINILFLFISTFDLVSIWSRILTCFYDGNLIKHKIKLLFLFQFVNLVLATVVMVWASLEHFERSQFEIFNFRFSASSLIYVTVAATVWMLNIGCVITIACLDCIWHRMKRRCQSDLEWGRHRKRVFISSLYFAYNSTFKLYGVISLTFYHHEHHYYHTSLAAYFTLAAAITFCCIADVRRALCVLLRLHKTKFGKKYLMRNQSKSKVEKFQNPEDENSPPHRRSSKVSRKIRKLKDKFRPDRQVELEGIPESTERQRY